MLVGMAADETDPRDVLVELPGCPKPFAPLGVGTWAWGDRDIWGMGGYDPNLSIESIERAWETSVAGGVTLFDTAEVYGGGESERIIGHLLANDPSRRNDLVIATKFLPSPQKLNVRTSLRQAVVGSLERLGIDQIDLYQLHGPVSVRSHGALAEALAGVCSEGLVSAVGVSNYSVREMTKIHSELAKRGVALASNQIEFSPLRRRPETTGLIAACGELGVLPLAYSPLGQGRLTGKYSASNPPPGKRFFSAFPMDQVDPIVQVLREIGTELRGMDTADGAGDGTRSPGQVALRWIIEKGAVPIPGAKNAAQAAQNAGALGWRLTPEQITRIDAVALEGQRTLKQRIWQHG